MRKTIDLPNELGFIAWTWHNISVLVSGLAFDFGWFPNLELAALSITLMEWREDGEGNYWGMTVFRFQVLYFMVSCSLNDW